MKAGAVAADGEKTKSATYSAGQIFVPPPAISGVQNSTGTPIPEPVSVSPGATIYLVGNYFGCKAPNVWFEHLHNGRIKQTKCKILKNLFTNTYPDPKGKASCMNCTTGASRVPVEIPAANKIPDGGFLGFIVIDNGLGRDTFDLTVE